MLGAILGGYIQDRAGRRRALALGSFLSAIAVAICFVSDLPDAIESRRGVFLAGKFFQGVCIGMLLCVVQTYMSEVLPVLLRGPLIAFLPVFTLLGQLVGAVVVYTCLKYTGSKSYRICFGSQWPFSVVPFVLAAVLPESPTWLVRKGRVEKAVKAQERLDTANVNSEAIIEEIRLSILAEEEERGTYTYMDCFRGIHARRTFIVAFASALPQFFGLQLLANASYFAEQVGMSSTNALTFLILGIGLGLVANIASLWALNAFGRRFLSFTTMITATVLWFAMGIAGCFTSVVTVW
jgi:MFS family permease